MSVRINYSNFKYIYSEPPVAGQVLGNVMATVNDQKRFDGNSFIATVTSAKTYYPFGMLETGRQVDASTMRWGYQGQETDNEIKGDGNSVNYKYRVRDPRLGRFFSIDPLAAKYPHNSPYAFSENRVIDGIELEGLEFLDVDNSGINPENAKTQNGTYSFDLGETHFTDVEMVTIGDKQYFDLGKHMYYGDNGWSTSGNRKEQITGATEVGIYLTYYLNSLSTPTGFASLSMSDYEGTIKYGDNVKNCGGVCYLVSMLRVNKAYKDLNIEFALDLDQNSLDYILAGTDVNSNLAILDANKIYKFYGVGGAIAAHGYATLVNSKGVWNGDLQEGAQIQSWHVPYEINLEQRQYSIAGHSMIFLSYIYQKDKIIGFNVVDNRNMVRQYYKRDCSNTIFLGANLKD